MHQAINNNNKKIDSLKKLIKLSSADFSKIDARVLLYNSSSRIGVYAFFKSNDATMMQLKTSGLQLIRKDHVADSIAAYDSKIKTVYEAEVIYTKATDDALLATQNIYDYSITNDTAYFTNGNLKNVLLPLYIDDKASLPRFFNKINFEMAATAAYIYNIKEVLPFTERLIAYFKKEYDIK